MATFTFEIPGRLPGLNELIGANRAHRMAGAALKKKTQTFCGQYIVASRVPKFSEPVTVEFTWIEPNSRRDLDNITTGAKFILDALVETQTIANDTRAWITGISHSFPNPEKDNPRVIVTLKEGGK